MTGGRDEPEHVGLLRETLRRFVAHEMPPEAVRRWDREHRFPRDVFAKLAALEREVKARLDGHDAAIVDVLRRFMEILDPPPLPDPPPKPPIGFGVKEKSARYGTKKKRAVSPTSEL